MSANFVSAVGDSSEIKRSTAPRQSATRPGAGEVLVVGTLMLAALTALVLRFPYRAPVVNSLSAGLALASFYAYLRLRLGIRLPMGVFVCFVISVVLDIVGNQYGLFSQRIASVPYDIITHFAISGLGFVAVMWLLTSLINRYGYQLPLGVVAFFSATTTFSLSAYYEITELLDERLFGGHRLWTPRDSVQDLAADLVGIVVAAIAYTVVVRKRWRFRGSRFSQHD